MTPRGSWCLPLVLLLLANAAAAQTVRIAGTVRSGGTLLPSVQVEALRGAAVAASALTDGGGRFALVLEPGEYELVFRHVGYAEHRLPGVRVGAGGSSGVDAELSPRAFELDPLAVTALRRTEKALTAPASITVLDTRTVQERTSVTGMDHMLGVGGVDVAMQGLQGRQVVARGFNQTFGTSLLMLSDYRNAAVPSLRGNLSHYITPIAEDMERVEVLRGPASALYGQNAADGVVHFLTRSPFDSPGTALSVTAGTRELFQGTARHAAQVGDAVAFRVSGRYLRGEEWDSPAQPLELTRRDPVIERVNAETRVDYRAPGGGVFVLNAGTTLAKRHVEYTGIGASQVKDWRYHFGQLRYNRERFFAQAYVNVNDAGETMNLRTNEQVHDASVVAVAQVQHGTELWGRSVLTYGLDLQRTVPRTDGTISGRNEDDDVSMEAGTYLQAETRLSRRFEIVTAARVDRHNRMDGLQFSPRLAVLFSPRPESRWRISYNRAFNMPTSTDLFLDLLASRLDPLPFGLRAAGVPQEGFRYARDCSGGLCMRSPFAPGSALPLDATQLWPAVVAIMQANGVDLSALPAPRAEDVRTVLRILDPTAAAFRAYEGEPRDIAPLEPTITNSLELGYKALLGQRLLLDAAVYATRRENFRGPLAIETPNAFLSTADLTAYLGQYLPAPSAAALATAIGGIDGSAAATGIPLATVAPDHELAGSDLLLTYRNFGEVELWGGDITAELLLSERISVGGSYSYTSDNFFPGNARGEADLAMNVPQHRGALSVRYRDPRGGWSGELRSRHAGGFEMVDGVWTGHVDGFNTITAELGVPLRWLGRARLVVTADNLADERHAEFVGAPVLGRLLLTRLQYQF